MDVAIILTREIFLSSVSIGKIINPDGADNIKKRILKFVRRSLIRTTV